MARDTSPGSTMKSEFMGQYYFRSVDSPNVEMQNLVAIIGRFKLISNNPGRY